MSAFYTVCMWLKSCFFYYKVKLYSSFSIQLSCYLPIITSDTSIVSICPCFLYSPKFCLQYLQEAIYKYSCLILLEHWIVHFCPHLMFSTVSVHQKNRCGPCMHWTNLAHFDAVVHDSLCVSLRGVAHPSSPRLILFCFNTFCQQIWTFPTCIVLSLSLFLQVSFAFERNCKEDKWK